MSVAHIITRGFGNGSLEGEINEVVTAGYTPGVIRWEEQCPSTDNWSTQVVVPITLVPCNE